MRLRMAARTGLRIASPPVDYLSMRYTSETATRFSYSWLNILSRVKLLIKQSIKEQRGRGVGPAGADSGGGFRGVLCEGLQGGDDQEHCAGGEFAVSCAHLLVLP